MIRVSIYEDNKEIRTFLSEIVASSAELFLVNAYPNAINLIKQIKNDKPDVVLMDIQLPEISGIEAVSIIKELNADIQILMQTVFDDNARIFAAICAGASGYILKDSSPEKYIDAIIEVYQGGSAMSPSIARKVMTMFAHQNKSIKSQQFHALSGAEQKILDCLVKGMSYKMIAAEIQISFSTVNFHLKNIYKKLHVNSATEAVAMTLRL